MIDFYFLFLDGCETMIDFLVVTCVLQYLWATRAMRVMRVIRAISVIRVVR